MINFSKPFPYIPFGICVLVNNLLGLVASIKSYFFHPKLWEENFWGVILILSFLVNFGIILITQRYWTHAPPERRIHFVPIKIASLLYIFYSFIAFFATGALLQKVTVGIWLVNLLFICGMGLGITMLLYPRKICSPKFYNWGSARKIHGRRSLRVLVGILMVFYSVHIGLYVLKSMSLGAQFLNYILSGNVISLGLCTLTLNTLNIWIIPRTWSKTKHILYAVLCLFITIMAFNSSFRLVTSASSANGQFQTAFGDDWNEFSSNIQENFLPSPMSVSGLILGPDYRNRANNFVWIEKLCYHNESNYQLYYDVYYPITPVPEVGNNSTVLYFSGGFYISGARTNAQMMCEYLASQGYVVFCVDYRIIDVNLLALSNEAGFNIPSLPIKPNYRAGNYTFTDMISDVGEFTKYLEARPDYYGADYSNVFFYAESAGGHLAATVAYGWNNPWYAGNFSTTFTLKGIMLFYPPIVAAKLFYQDHPVFNEKLQLIPGTPGTNPIYYYATPSYLIDNTSIPCIIFHGIADKFVPIQHSDDLRKAMVLFNRTCIQIRFKAIGHGFAHDYQYQYFCLYYMERFLYLVK